MEENATETYDKNVRVELQGGDHYTYFKKKVKLPEITIQCPACNDVEHRMTIFFNQLHPEECYIQCKNCDAMFKLIHTKIESSSRTASSKTIYESTPSSS